MIAQGLRLQRAFMSISNAADREAVVRFAIERARGKHAELFLADFVKFVSPQDRGSAEVLRSPRRSGRILRRPRRAGLKQLGHMRLAIAKNNQPPSAMATGQ
jgi:hypothetical protein